MYSNGSPIGIRTAVCTVCGKTHETNEILIHKNLKNVFPSSGKAKPDHYELCEEHRKLFNDGYLALVGIDPEKSEFGPEDVILPSNAHRTGHVVHMRRKAFLGVFNVPNPVDSKGNDLPFVFVEDAVINHVQKLAKEAEEAEETN